MKLKACWLIALVTLSSLSTARDDLFFDSDGVNLRYLMAGSGTPVVLLHGFSGSADGLYVKPGTFDALVDAGFRVVALDQRGHGRSDKPYGAADYGMHMVEDVRRLLDHLGLEQVHLVGYSMGGKVGNTFRSKYPDRLLTITLGGYGWPWQSAKVTLAGAEARLQQGTVFPGNDLKALAAVRVGMNALTPSETSLRSNTVPAFAIIGDKDEAVSEQDLATFRDTMANLKDMAIIPGTHAGPDGAPYKPAFAEKLIEFFSGY